MAPKDHFKLQHISREKKLQLFLKEIAPQPGEIILDIGSAKTSFFLQSVDPAQIITTDISEKKIRSMDHPVLGKVVADATTLPFKNNSIDVIFSNAVIEHVGDYTDQRSFANEVQRVARRAFFVTTPNKLFPYEFHYRMPFFQFIPKNIQKQILNYQSVGWVKKGQWQDINLLTPTQFHRLFPEATLIQQRITILPETLICYQVTTSTK